jgi:glycosyltransferase involved in cell wall biosynthesis
MKVAHLSKPWLPVPSVAYGAIEKLLASLIEAQTKLSNVIFLYAPGGSMSSVGISLRSLYVEGQGDKGLDRNTELAQAVHCAKESSKLHIDLIHSHSVDPFLGITPFLKTPSVFTFYSNPTSANKILSDLAQKHTTFTFLTKSHRKNFPWIKNAEIIYFGIDPNQFPFSERKEEYLAFVGSIADKKGIVEAIEIAKTAKIKLKIAAKVKIEDKDFYEKEVKKLIESSRNIEFLGELNDQQRNTLLKSAKAMLFPIKWEEPLGMVMLESMVVGTPVIAFNRGSVPEIITDGVSGYIVENISQAVNAIDKINSLTPASCRKTVVDNFNIDQTARAFQSLYQRILSK